MNIDSVASPGREGVAAPGAALLRDIESTPPARALAALLWTLVALGATLLVWALVGQLDIVATAPGRLVPFSQVKLVQSAEPGIVREILVRDGDPVTAGQVLLRLDATVAGADAAALAGELMLRRVTVRAIDAELAGRPLLADAGDDVPVFSQVQAHFAARRQALLDSLAQEEQAGARARGDLLAARRLRDKLSSTLPLLQQSADSHARLQREGFVGELLAAEKRREVLEREGDLKVQQAAVEALAASVAQSERRREQLRSNYRAELLGERVDAAGAVQRLEQESHKSGLRARLMEVRAPHDGIVKDLAVHTLGAVVQAGSPLLQVVPTGDLLRAEALLANEDIGFVEVGQPVKLKLAAYPFQKFGMLEGRVLQISADAIAQSEAARTSGISPVAAPVQTYRAVIELAEQGLRLPNGRTLDIAPGMALTAEIHQGRRTVIEYLLSPLQRVAMEAGRER
ncbi:MAG: HlyD family type I secretion periplasmic adaptor subunit [Burkholderiales bacterium]|nr:MAG: HlyD family type I secretion periplasmic adaptor subunit [Burkholderiales bacterium]